MTRKEKYKGMDIIICSVTGKYSLNTIVKRFYLLLNLVDKKIKKGENMDFKSILDEIKEVAKEVGEYQLKNFRKKDLIIDSKSNVTDLVTEVDKGSEDIILKHIRENYPDHAILAEETGRNDKKSDYLWIIDPLDGTNNYAQGLPIFCTSIGLRYKGETVLGVVYAPYIDEMYYAVKGGGAYYNGTPIKVGEETALNRCVVATGFPYDKGTNELNNLKYFGKLMPQLRGVRRMGAAAYDLCCVACGTLDAYWEMDIKPWDVEAGNIIIEEAGGVVESFRDDRNISIAVGNEKIVEVILENLREVDNNR